MLDLLTYRRYLVLLAGMFSLLAALPAGAARLIADKTEIAVGETARITLSGVPVLAVVRWEVSRELELLDSDRKGATVKGKSPGDGTVTMKLNLGSKSAQIVVRASAAHDPATPSQPVTGEILYSKPAPDNAAAVGSDSYRPAMSEEEIERDPYFIQLKGLASFRQYPKSIQIARLLLAFKGSEMSPDAAALKFYQDLAGGGMTMFDVIQTKSYLNNAGLGEHYLGEAFREAGSPVEMALLTFRRQVTLDGIRHVVEMFKGRQSNHAVFLAEIGKWARQADRALTFSGDIDFSFVSNDTNLTWEMKQAFDAYIASRTGLVPTAFDSVCTAHGRATLDVYIGDHGKMYGDTAMKDGGLKLIDLANGSIAAEAQKGRPIILHMVMEQRAARHQAGLPELKAHLEPGLSMEMVRHFNHDIVAPKLFDPIDSILKASKYLDRSNTALNDIPGATPDSPELAEFAREITKAAQTSNWNKIAELIKVHFRDAMGTDALKFEAGADGGRMTADLQANETVIDAFFKRCTDAMWKNVQAGFEYKIKDLYTKIWNAEQKKLSLQELQDLRGEMKQIVEMIKIELLAAKQNHLTVPDEVIKLNDRLNAMVDDFLKKQGARPLSEAEMKELEFIKDLIEAKTPSMHAKAIAFIVDRAGKSIDKSNNILDWIDDKLLNDLRGQNPEFDDFVNSVKSARADVPADGWGQAEAYLNKTKLTVVNTKAYQTVQKVNTTLNDVLNKTTARRGAMKAMMAVNLAQEIPAYYEAWGREGYAGLATEFFRRRVPGGGAIDAYFQGDFLQMGAEIVYVIFPPAAIPQGLYGMTRQAAGWTAGKMDTWNYDAMVDELFKGAQFEKQGKDYVISGIKYRCYTYVDVTLNTREDILALPKNCPRVFDTILPQIQNHPVLLSLQDLLKNPNVSSGPSGKFPFTYDTSGSKYGQQLNDLYLRKVDDVVQEYFKGVVEKLEAAKKWAVGSGYANIIRIERELNCAQSLATYTVGALGGDDALGDAERFQKIVADYDGLKAANKSVLEIKAKWAFDQPEEETRNLPDGTTYAWGKDYLPECAPKSIQEKSALAAGDAAAFKGAIPAAMRDVEKIVGQDYCQNQPGGADLCFKRVYWPATQAALCKAYYKDRNRFINKDCEDKYAAALKDLEGLRSSLRIDAIDGADTACVGRPSELRVALDRDCPDCVAAWEVLGYATEAVHAKDKLTAVWTPKFAGKGTLRVSVSEKPGGGQALVKEIPVEVLTASSCPALRLIVNSDRDEIEENEPLQLSADPESPTTMRDQVSQYVWTENDAVMPASRGQTHAFSGLGRRGQKIKVSVKAKTETGWTDIAYRTIGVKTELTNELHLTILPTDKNTLVAGKPFTFGTKVQRRADSGLLRYQWSAYVNDRAVAALENNREAEYTLPALPLKEKDKVRVVVYIQDTDNNPKSKKYGQLIREGQAEKTMAVNPAGDIELVLSDTPPSITDAETLTVCVEKPVPASGEPSSAFRYEWQFWEARSWHVSSNTRCGSVAGRGMAGQTLKLKVKVTDAYGRSVERETPMVQVLDAPDYSLTILTDSSEAVPLGTPVALQAKPSDALRALSGMRIVWLQAGTPIGDGESLSFKPAREGDYVLQAVALAPQGGGEAQVASAETRVTVKKPAPVDKPPETKPPGTPQAQAEAKYQWLKDSLVYLEVLKEYDRKTFASFKAGVSSAMVRQFVAAHPKPYDDSAKLPENCADIISDVILQADCFTAKQAGCGSTVGEARTRMNQYGAECSSALTKGCSVLRMDESIRRINGKDEKVAEPYTDCDDLCGKSRACDRMFSVYSGRTGYANDVQAHVNENSIRCLGEAGAANGKNQRELAKKIEALPESLPFKRWQEYKAYNDWSGYLAAVDKVKQEFKLPEPIPSPPTLPWKYASPCGGAGAVGPPTPDKGELTVTLAGPSGSASLKLGEPQSLSAGVSGGKPPYRYEWTGASGSGAKGTAKPAWAGDWTVLVMVTDADGKTGEAKTTLRVQPLALKLTGAKGKVYYGRTYTINAEGLEPTPAPKPEPKPDPCAGHIRTNNPFDECNTIIIDPSKSVSVAPPGDLPPPPIPTTVGNTSPNSGSAFGTSGAAGPYRYIWQADPAVTFNAPTTDKPSTKVTYDRMGQVKLWCEAHTFVEGAWHTIGECDQVSVEVIAPAFTFTFTPPTGQGRIGQEVRAVLSTKPEVAAKYLDYRWFDPGSSNRMEYTQNASDIGFKVTDAKPIPLKVLARVPHFGDTIADLSSTYTGVAYDVRIGAPRLNGPQLQVWVCDTQLGRAQQCGMKDIPTGQFVTFQDIYLKALVTPAPESPRYRWTVSPSGSCGLPGAGSELHLNCSSTGTYTVNLEVADADGNILGKAESSVSVSVKTEQTQPGKHPDTGANEKVRQAKQLVEQGKLDEAMDLVTEAVNLDAQHPEAGPLRNRWLSERQQVIQHVGEARQAIDRDQLDDARKSVAAARKLHPRFQPVVDAERLLDDSTRARDAKVKQAGQLAATAQEQIRAGQYEDALTSIGNLRAVDPVKAGALAKELAGAARQAAKAAEQTRDFDKSGRLFGVAREADPADIEAIRGVNNAPIYGQRMKEVRAWQDDTRNALNRGDYDTSGKRLYDIKNWESTLPGPLDQQTRALESRHQGEFAAYQKAMDGLKNRAEKAMLARNCAESRKLVDEVTGRRPVDQERKWIDMMNATLAERAQRGECGTKGSDAIGTDAVKPPCTATSEPLVTGTYDGPGIRVRTGNYGNNCGACFGNATEHLAALCDGKARCEYTIDYQVIGDPKPGCAKDYVAVWRCPDDATWYAASAAAEAGHGKKVVLQCPGKAGSALPADSPLIGSGQGAGAYHQVDLAPVGGKKGTPRTAKGILIDDGSWLRFKATDEKRLTLDIPVATPFQTAAVAVISNLDDATYLEQGKAIARVTVIKDSGNETLTIQAGVHSSEWNSSAKPKHAWFKDGFIGGDRFLAVLPLVRPGVVRSIRIDYVETGAQKWYGHAPGFCLRGITLIRDAVTGDAAVTPGGRDYTGPTITETPVTVPVTTASGGPETSFQGHRYRAVLVPGGITWPNAERAARELGGYLATIASAAENDAVYSLVRNDDRFWYQDSYRNGIGPWLGGLQPAGSTETRGGWRWATGEPFNYANWGPNQPDNAGSGEDRLQLFGNQTLKSPVWNDITGNLGSVRGYIVEFGAPAPATTPETATGGFVRIEACVDGSDWFGVVNGRLSHEHRAFNQVGSHDGCPASHAVSGGGVLIDGRKVGLGQLPLAVGIGAIARIEVERGRGKVELKVRLDGQRWLLIDDDGDGGPSVYAIRLYGGAATTQPDQVPTQGQVSFDNGNIGGVGNGPTQPTTFTFNEPRVLTLIQNYHWNSGRGATPGTIAVRDAYGTTLGPWQTTGSPGQGGVANAYWTARPNVTLPAGTYTVLDANPATWSHNGQSGNRGFTRVESLPVGAAPVTPGGRDYTGLPPQGDPVGLATPSKSVPMTKGQVILEIGNTGGVDNKPSNGAKFTLATAQVITLIQNYHWNQGRGATPGTIALRSRDKKTYGPWPADGSPGQGGVANAYWTVRPNVTLPAGTYSIVDSDPATWSHNAQSDNRGFTRIEGYPAQGAASPAASTPSTGDEKIDATIKQVDDLLDAVKSLKGLFGK